MRNPFLFLMILFTVTTLATSAQFQQPFVRSIKPVSDSADRKLSILNSLYNKKWYHAGVQVDAVSMGKVYRMPIDNMLCLVPDEKNTSRMPVQKITRMPEQMPNAFRRRGMNR
jgi:hypothetical protein